MVKLKLLPWWQFHISECRIIQGMNFYSSHTSVQEGRAG